jgi:hypothetical protein
MTAPLHAQTPYDLGEAVRSNNQAPKLIILIHGGTPAPNDAASTGIPEPNSGTLDHVRFYFGYDFVRRLLNVGKGTGLKTLSGNVLTASEWSEHTAPNANGKYRMVHGANENNLDDHFIVPGNFTGNGTPNLSVMLVYRDGSRSLMQQTKDVVNQAMDLYTRKFGTERNPAPGKTLPNIILVGHSMGTLVSRTLLTVPTDPILGVSLTNEERQKAEAIRDKTLYCIALAGPHEGSPLADRALELVRASNNFPTPLKSIIDTASDALVHRPLIGSIQSTIQGMLGTGENQSVTTAALRQFNQGVLAPHKAKRSDGTVVPIYTLVGHSPGGAYFSTPKEWPLGGATASNLTDEEGRRNYTRAAAMMMIDYIFHNAPSDGAKTYGNNQGEPDMDKTARYHKPLIGDYSNPGENPGIPLGFPVFYNAVRERNVRTNRDGEMDSDGLVPVNSGLGAKLGTNTLWYFDHSRRWNITGQGNTPGSWYRLSSNDAPWEFTNHETIQRTRGVGAWLYENIIQEAGPIASPNPISIWPIAIFNQLVTLPKRTLLSEDLLQRLDGAKINYKVKKIEEGKDD